ncbi:MAG TPA: iron ABC transporter permease [Nitrosomonas sp.]|nr:iron ABC transporter permease [Nitrosomonas sp.]
MNNFFINLRYTVDRESVNFNQQPLLLFIGLFFFAIASLLVGISFGSVDISRPEIAQILSNPSEEPHAIIIWELRLPRVLTAFACGSLLALAGALLQVLLRNPLADPYILGISGGASVGALTAMILGWSTTSINIASSAGALTIIGLIFSLNFRSPTWNIYRLLLIGVVLSAACNAVITLLLALAPAHDTKGMLFWLMGDLSRSQASLSTWGVLIILCIISTLLASEFNVLSIGQLKARSLGIAVNILQILIFLIASIATVTALMQAGAIGFIGLLMPHAIRLVGVNDYRWLIPCVILLGGGFLVFADTLARTLWAPQQLPVGVLTALLGAPLLLVLLIRKRF